MRLFIAREALDKHLRVAGDCGDAALSEPRSGSPAWCAPGASTPHGIRRAGSGWSGWPRYGGFGPLARHLRWVDRTARRLARQQFHLMVLNGPALEKKQAQLFRCVDIGAELFAMAATCVRAHDDVRRSARTPPRSGSPTCSAAWRGTRWIACSRRSARTPMQLRTASRAMCSRAATRGSSRASSRRPRRRPKRHEAEGAKEAAAAGS
jgi:hypothetical protein